MMKDITAKELTMLKEIVNSASLMDIPLSCYDNTILIPMKDKYPNIHHHLFNLINLYSFEFNATDIDTNCANLERLFLQIIWLLDQANIEENNE